MNKKKKHTFGWPKAFSLYSFKYFGIASIFPLCLTVASFVASLLSDNEPIFFIELLSSIILNISPVIIGFLLSGYAIIIGFSSNEVVRFMSKRSDNTDKTLYQRQNAVFAVSILSLLIGLILGVFSHFVAKSGINFFPSDIATNVLNYITLFVLLFVVYFSIISVKDMVVNVFNFGQMIHYLTQKGQSKQSDAENE